MVVGRRVCFCVPCDLLMPVHNRQMCWKVNMFRVQYLLLNLPYIRALDTLRLDGLGCCELLRKGEQGQFSGK